MKTRLSNAPGRLLAALLGLVALWLPGFIADAATFTVNSSADPGDGACDGIECTLREAINAANANPGADTIGFAIGGGGPQTILLQSALPLINQSISIDGTTQPSFAGSPLITIDAANAGNGLFLHNASSSLIRGIAVENAANAGIVLQGVTDSTVLDCTASWGGSGQIGIGVSLYQCARNTVERVTALSREKGISVFFADDTLLRDNRLSGAVMGIFAGGQRNKFFGNDLSFASTYPIELTGDTQFEIAGNDFSHSANGLKLVSVEGLTASPNPGPGQISMDVSTVSGVGLWIEGVRNSQFTGLDLTWGGATVSGRGIFMYGGSDNRLSAITARQRLGGVETFGSDRTTLSDLDLTWTGVGQQGYGVAISASSGSTVERVTSRNRVNGVYVFAEDNLVRDNRLSGATYGINAGGQRNKFFGNDLSFASSYPIVLNGDTQFEIAGNDISHSANGLKLFNQDGLVASPNPGPGQISMDVSTIPGVALFLTLVRNSQFTGLDLSWNGQNAGSWSIAPGWNIGAFVEDSPQTILGDVTVRQREVGISVSSQNVLVECSSIHNNAVGIRINHLDPVGVVIQQCQISGNSNGGLLSHNTVLPVSAEYNFWGTSDGPAPLGSGNSFSGNVDVEPVLSVPPACVGGGDLLDPTFGICGKVITDVSALPDLAPPQRGDTRLHIAMQADGKIVVGFPNQDDGTGRRFAVLRYHANGTLDPTFGTGGIAVMDFPGFIGGSMTLDRDGKVVLAGYAPQPDTGTDWVIGRRNLDGSADTSFDGDGWAVVDFDGDDYVWQGNAVQARLVAVDSQNRIVVKGRRLKDGGGQNSLARLNPDGSLDTSFDGDGKLVHFFSYDGFAVALDPNDRILVAGWVSSPNDFLLYRLNLDGSFDSTFGIDGKVRLDFEGRTDIASFVSVDGNGRIVVAGTSEDPVSHQRVTAIARLQADGSLDATFSGDGKRELLFDWPTSMAVDSAGRIVIGGNSYTCVPGNCTTADFEAFRFTEGGALDPAFGGDGRVTVNFCGSSYELTYDISIDSQNNVILPGRITTGPSAVAIAMVRILSGDYPLPTTPCTPPPPSITCPTDIAVAANAAGFAAIPDLRSQAVLNGVSPCNPATVSQDPAPGTVVTCGLHPITLSLTDTAGHTSSCTTMFTVTCPECEPPTIVGVTGAAAPLSLGTSATVTAHFAAADAGSGRACAFAWGDGTSDFGLDASASTCAASHTYASAGVYRVTVTASNNCGDTDTEVHEFVVVYDPDGGFVTGGGWINSPAGAYVANPALTGKANFGFVAKYRTGANVPSGNTEFQFKAGDLNFKSASYDWLVVAGAKAKFKGSGTINGSGDYAFQLTATDSQANGGGGADMFRIKIWSKSGGGVIYDNQPGDPDTAAATTALGGGSIVVHKP